MDTRHQHVEALDSLVNIGVDYGFGIVGISGVRDTYLYLYKYFLQLS